MSLHVLLRLSFLEVPPRTVLRGAEEREKWVVVTDTRMGEERGGKNLSSVLKVPRQRPLVLPVRVKHLTGINLNLISWRLGEGEASFNLNLNRN
jgi:hypothetical protein